MSTQPSQHHLEVPGGRLYYEVRGSGPLLLVIGQPMTSAPFGIAIRLAWLRGTLNAISSAKDAVMRYARAAPLASSPASNSPPPRTSAPS